MKIKQQNVPWLAGVLVASLFLVPMSFALADTSTSPQQTGTSTEESQETEEIKNSTSTSSEDDQDGTDGKNGTSSEETTEIETGDAQATAVAENEVNTTDVTVTTTATSSEDATSPQISGTSSETSSATSSASSSEQTTNQQTSTTTVSTKNNAKVDNDIDVEADTGNNTATSNESVEIETGDAFAYASILNQVNSTFFQSPGAIMLLNNLFGNLSEIDLRDSPIFNQGEQGNKHTSSTCSENCETTTNESVTTNNNVEITNSATVRSSTGGNRASGTKTEIKTGDAYAAADIINLANTTLSHSSYLLFSFQNFGSWGGDLVFPSSDVFSEVFNNTGNDPEPTSEASTTEGESIGTVIDNSNANLKENDQFVVALRVHGDWTGEVFNAPDNLLWAEDASGLQIFTVGSDGELGQPGNTNTSVTTTNQAEVENNVEVFSLTGDNQATSTSGESKIETGQAYAASNIINIVNTTVVGQNMLLAVLNIFGDWDGNISFGQPDLWVGGMATPDHEDFTPGSEVTFTYDVTNRGDAPAHNVVLDTELDGELHFIPEDSSATSTATSLSVPVGDIDPGETTQVSAKAEISPELADKNKEAENKIVVTLEETDNNNEDNRETINLTLNQFNPNSISNPTGLLESRITRQEGLIQGASDNKPLKIEKTAEKQVSTSSTLITYNLQVINQSDQPLFDSLVSDVLVDDTNQIIHREDWELGQIHPHEEINISYTVSFGKASGVVKNSAQAHARTTDNPETAQVVASKVASTTTAVEGMVAGASTGICSEYLTSYLRANQPNHTDEVIKLQKFLRNHEGVDLEITGAFGMETEIAVRRFQSKYAEDVLAPWDLENPTGYVYMTTKEKINDLYCGDRITKETLEQLDTAARELGKLLDSLAVEPSNRRETQLAEAEVVEEEN